MATILLVDDEPSARMTLALLLKGRGHGVHEASDVASALTALETQPFDVVITDLRMPDGLGLVVLRKAAAECPDAHVILLTAYPEWESAKEAMRLGAFDYFEKAQEPEALFERIDRALEDQAARRRRALVQPGGTAGTPRPGTGSERRYLTVLFADMRQSMELIAGRDLDQAREVLDAVIERMMESVHWAGGTVNQVMGDGIMGLFGAPVAYPDHAARACHAALRMQAAVARYAADLRRSRGVDVQIRVGINTGEVILRSVGSDLRWDYTAVGTPTHVAARMEQLARPGSTVITAETLRQLDGDLHTRPLGRVPVKGLSEPMEAHEVLGLRSTCRTPTVACRPRGPWR